MISEMISVPSTTVTLIEKHATAATKQTSKYAEHCRASHYVE